MWLTWLLGVLLVLYGGFWGYDYGKRAGKRAGDREHEACHVAQAAIIEQSRQGVPEGGH